MQKGKLSGLFHAKKNSPEYPYDPQKERPAIRASICTGEQVAGFRNLETGRFHEVRLIKTDKDLREFQQTYGVDRVDKEY